MSTAPCLLHLSSYTLGISQTAARPDGCLSEWRRIMQKEGRHLGWTEHRTCYWKFGGRGGGGGVTETSVFAAIKVRRRSSTQFSSAQFSSAQFLSRTQGRSLQGFLGTLWRKLSKNASASCWWQCGWLWWWCGWLWWWCGWLWWWFRIAWHQNHTFIIRATKSCYWVHISSLSDIGHVSVLPSSNLSDIGHVSILPSSNLSNIGHVSILPSSNLSDIGHVSILPSSNLTDIIHVSILPSSKLSNIGHVSILPS